MHACTHTHTTIHKHRHFQRFFETMEKWLVTHHLVLLKTDGSTVNLGTITTRKNHKKVQEYVFNLTAVAWSLPELAVFQNVNIRLLPNATVPPTPAIQLYPLLQPYNCTPYSSYNTSYNHTPYCKCFSITSSWSRTTNFNGWAQASKVHLSTH